MKKSTWDPITLERSEGLTHLDTGIFIRTTADFETVWRHFRKFTRIQDENGKWYYWRFWETKVLSYFFSCRNFPQLFSKILTTPKNLIIVPIFGQKISHQISSKKNLKSLGKNDFAELSVHLEGYNASRVEKYVIEYISIVPEIENMIAHDKRFDAKWMQQHIAFAKEKLKFTDATYIAAFVGSSILLKKKLIGEQVRYKNYDLYTDQRGALELFNELKAKRKGKENG